MANWTNLSVKNAITKIKDGEIVLPVIQRRLVWTEEKMEMLFDSLLKGNSFGSVICIEEEKNSKPLFAFREFTRDGNPVTSTEVDELSKTQWFIIDGQQRLQSFYIGLVGTFNGKHMFFDLFSNYSEDEYEFKFATKAEDLTRVNKERSDSSIQDCLWYSVSGMFTRLADTNDDDQVAEEIIKRFNVIDEQKIKHIERNVRNFYRGIFNAESLGVSKVSVNKSKNAVENRQRIVELFRRLNDGGTKLSSYDLVASMFKGFDYRMEQFLDTVVFENSDIGIDQDVLIKLLLILHDKPSKEMSDLTAEDAEFATSHFERIQATLKALKNFLHVSSLYNWFSAGKNRSAIPLYFLAYHIFHAEIDTNKLENTFDQFETKNTDFHEMSIWLRKSLLNKVFSRGCGWIPYKTGVKKIHTVMSKSKGSIFPTEALFSVYRLHPLYFTNEVTAGNLDGFDQEFLFYLLYNGMPSIRSEDIDHIHPRWVLEGNGVEGTKINSIGNYQLLDSRTNRGSKNGKELCIWIENHIEDSNREDYLKRHLIPTDPKLWKSSEFEGFLQERTNLLAERLRSFL